MDLNRASAFVRVVEAGGFTRAATAMGLPASSVSRSVSALERDLGITLLERTTRKVALTEAGRAFFERAREALAGLEEANSLAREAALDVQGAVRIAVPLELGSHAGSMFASLAHDYPQIRLEITFTNRGVELVGDLVDIAVVIGKLPDSSLVTRRLGEATNRLYASPDYVARRGHPRAFADLAKHDVILSRAIAGTGRLELTGPRGVEHVDVEARMVADHVQFIADAAISGVGVALLPSWLGDRGVEDGTLVQVLPRFSTQMPMHVLAHAGRHLARRVVIVRDYLVGVLGASCTKHHAPTAS